MLVVPTAGTWPGARPCDRYAGQAASGRNVRPEALPTRALPREPDAATPRADPSQPEVHHMTDTPSPEDRAPTEPETTETVANSDPAADPVQASEGNGDPAHPT